MLDNDQIRNHAHKVLQGKDFQKHAPKEESYDFWQWLKDHVDWNWKFPFESDMNGQVLGLTFKIICFFAVAAFIGYIIYLICSKIFKKSVYEQKINSIKITDLERQQAKYSYTDLAFKALEKENYREAIHYLFLAAMSVVIKDNFFNRADHMTNREIAKESDFSGFSAPGVMKSMFHDMVRFDESRWFGSKPATRDDYEQFYKYYDGFKQQVKRNAS